MTGGMGHNRPPKPRDPRDVKLEMIQMIMKSWGYSASEALVMIGIITESNDDFEARLSADQIMTYLKTKRKPSIWPVLRSLEKDHGVLVRNTVKGSRRNEYCVLPQRVIESVLEHYEDRNGRRVPASRPAPTKYAQRTKSEGKPSTPSVPSQGQPSTENVPVRSAYRYAQRTRSGAQPSTPSVPSQGQPSTLSVLGDDEKPNDPMRARADAGARAASSTSTSISSEDSIDVDVNSPRARELAKLPELDGINGATQDYVIALAECDKSIEVAGRLPDYEAAYRQVKSAHGLLGPEKLQVVFMQWELALQSKTMKNPLKSFGNFVQNAVERKQPAPKSTLKGSGVKNFSGLLMQQNGGNDA